MPSSAAAETESALVAASFGRQFYVRSPTGAWPDRVAVTRGKRTDVCVGDEVEVRLIGTDPQWTYLLIGVLIIAAVAIDQWIRKVAG